MIEGRELEVWRPEEHDIGPNPIGSYVGGLDRDSSPLDDSAPLLSHSAKHSKSAPKAAPPPSASGDPLEKRDERVWLFIYLFSYLVGWLVDWLVDWLVG